MFFIPKFMSEASSRVGIVKWRLITSLRLLTPDDSRLCRAVIPQESYIFACPQAKAFQKQQAALYSAPQLMSMYKECVVSRLTLCSLDLEQTNSLTVKVPQREDPPVAARGSVLCRRVGPDLLVNDVRGVFISLFIRNLPTKKLSAMLYYCLCKYLIYCLFNILVHLLPRFHA